MPTRLHTHLFPLLHALDDGKFHSGETLARSLAISRASVCNALTQAAALGVRVQAVRGRGYRVPQGVDWLDLDAVRRALGEFAAHYTLCRLETAASTNLCLLDAAEAGAADGTVHCTEYQTSGKGRRGRSWQSALAGGLAFSVLYRFESGPAGLAGLSLAVGLALARALNRHSPHAVQLKWPNDLVVGPRKLGGVLVDVRGNLDGPSLAVVGVGLNVRLPAGLRSEIEQAVIDLDEMQVAVPRNVLLADSLRALHEVISVFRAQGFAALREAWMAHDAYAGREVCLTLAQGEKVCGRADGVDAQGALLLVNPAGERVAHTGGEVSLRARR